MAIFRAHLCSLNYEEYPDRYYDLIQYTYHNSLLQDSTDQEQDCVVMKNIVKRNSILGIQDHHTAHIMKATMGMSLKEIYKFLNF